MTPELTPDELRARNRRNVRLAWAHVLAAVLIVAAFALVQASK